MLVIHHCIACIAATLSTYTQWLAQWCSGGTDLPFIAECEAPLPCLELPPARPRALRSCDTFNGHEDMSLHGQSYNSMKVLRVNNRVTGHDRPGSGVQVTSSHQ